MAIRYPTSIPHSHSGFVLIELPSFETIHSDRNCYRCWKSLIRRAGKKRWFDLLCPEIRNLTAKIRNRQHTAHDKSKSIAPTERKRILLYALDEISESQANVNVKRIADSPADFANGMTGVGQYVILAGVFLVEAMVQKRKFEQKLFGCLIMLAAIDNSLVDDIGRTMLSTLELQTVNCRQPKNVG